MLNESVWEEAFSMHMGKRIYLDMTGDFNDQDALKKNLDILCEAVDSIIHKQTEPSCLVKSSVATGIWGYHSHLLQSAHLVILSEIS